jgi:hypothetical protein
LFAEVVGKQEERVEPGPGKSVQTAPREARCAKRRETFMRGNGKLGEWASGINLLKSRQTIGKHSGVA